MADISAAGATTPSASTSANPQEANQQTAPVPAADEQPWKKIKHRVKVNGQEAEVGYDDLVNDYQLRQASHARMQEAAQLKRQLSEAWNAADPSNFFKAKNLDPEKWAEELLLGKLKIKNMTPEQRAQHEALERQKAEREDFERQKNEFETQQRQAYQQQITNQLDTEIFEAFKASNLEVDPVVVDIMARNMEAYFDQYGEMLPAKVALDHVREYFDTALERKMQSLSADVARQKLPKKLLDELRRQDVDLVRSQSPMRQQTSQGASQPSTPKPARRMSTEEMFRKMGEKFA